MWSEEAEKTSYGELMLNDQLDCEFCGRSVIGRFTDQLLSSECQTCRDDFEHLNGAGKIVIEDA